MFSAVQYMQIHVCAYTSEYLHVNLLCCIVDGTLGLNVIIWYGLFLQKTSVHIFLTKVLYCEHPDLQQDHCIRQSSMLCREIAGTHMHNVLQVSSDVGELQTELIFARLLQASYSDIMVGNQVQYVAVMSFLYMCCMCSLLDH